ncbi:MAG: radical SAM protein, partial [Desulfobacterales bacterium]
MAAKSRKATRQSIESEIGTIRKQWRGKISVALVYPNRYHIGMSNLGFQTVYRLLNRLDHVVCERAFLPETSASEKTRPTTVESNRPLTDADIIAFSISFENDYPHLLDILDRVGLPLKSESRTGRHPLVVAGGVACLLNPEPLAPFIDCFLIGEAEEILPIFFETFESRRDKKTVLKSLV